MMKKYSSRKKHCCTFLQPSIPLAHENDLPILEKMNSDSESYISSIQKDIFSEDIFSEGILINENDIEKTLVKLVDIMPQSLSICNELLKNHSNEDNSSVVCTSNVPNSQRSSEKSGDELSNLFDKLEVERKRRCKMTMTFKNNSVNIEGDAGDFRSDSVLQNSDYRQKCSNGMCLHKKLSGNNKNISNIEQFCKINKPFTNCSNFCNCERDDLVDKLESYGGGLKSDNESGSNNKACTLYQKEKCEEANRSMQDDAVYECEIKNVSNLSSSEGFVSILKKVSTEKEADNKLGKICPIPDKYETLSLSFSNDDKSENVKSTFDSLQNSSYLENISLISEFDEMVNGIPSNEYLYSIKTFQNSHQIVRSNEYERCDFKKIDKTKVKANINNLYSHDDSADTNYNNISRNSIQVAECNDVDVLPLSTIVEKLLTILTQSESRKSYSIIGNFHYEKTYIISLVSRFINNFVSFLQAKEKYESTKSSISRTVLKKYIEEFKNTIKELENVHTIPNSPPTPGILLEENCKPENVKPLTSLIKEKSNVVNKFMSFEKSPRITCKITDRPYFVGISNNIKNPIFFRQSNRQDKLNTNYGSHSNMNENISFYEQNPIPDCVSNNDKVTMPNKKLNYEYLIARGDDDNNYSDKTNETSSEERFKNSNEKNQAWNSNCNNLENNYYDCKNYEKNEPPCLVQENNSTITHNCFLYLKERINYNATNEASGDSQYQCHHCNYNDQCFRSYSQNIYLQGRRRKSFRNCKGNWHFRKHKKYMADRHSKHVKCIHSYSTQKRHSFSCDPINCNCQFEFLQENESDTNNNHIQRNSSQIQHDSIYLPQRENSSKYFVNSSHYIPQYSFENHKSYSNRNFTSKSNRDQILENNSTYIHYNFMQDSNLNNQIHDYMPPGHYEIPQKIEKKSEFEELSFILQILEKLYSKLISKDQEQLFDKILCTTNSIMHSERKKKLIQNPSIDKENKTEKIWKSAIEALIMLQTQLNDSSKFTLNKENKLEGEHRENFSHKSKNCVSAGEWIKQTIDSSHDNTSENQHPTH